MKKTLLALATLPAVLAVDARAEVTAEQVRALEERLAQLEAAAPVAAPAAERVRINGFLSAGVTLTDVEDGFTYAGLPDRASMDTDAVVGVQIDGKVNDRMRAVLQLVGRGDVNEFAVDAEWAYVSWRVSDRDLVRLGRQRFPFFVMSQYLDVGYAYPWSEPPQSVYQAGFPSSYNGISWQRDYQSGDWAHTVQAYYGREEFQVLGGNFRLDDGTGLSWQGSRGAWQFNVNYSQSKATFETQLDTFVTAAGLPPANKVIGWFGGLGLQYDDGAWLVLAEATQVNVKGYFPDTENFYVTVGHRFGKFLPHLTWSTSRTTDKDDRPDATAAYAALCPAVDPDPATSLCLAIVPNPAPPPTSFGVAFPGDTLSRLLNDERTTVALGLRYDVAENAALKFDWLHSLDTHGGYGGFSPNDGNVFTGALPDGDADVFRLGIDVVF